MELLSFLKNHWGMVWALITTAFSVGLVLLSKTYVKKVEIDVMKSQISALEGRILTMPSQKDFHQLQLEIAHLRGDLKAALPQLKQLRHLSDLLLQNELKQDK